MTDEDYEALRQMPTPPPFPERPQRYRLGDRFETVYGYTVKIRGVRWNADDGEWLYWAEREGNPNVFKIREGELK